METRRYNPYDESEDDKMDNAVGVVAGDEIGFAYWLDRDYKGKGDDVSAPFYLYQGGLEYPACAYCCEPIFGSFSFGKKGNKCFDCEKAVS